MPTNLPPDYYEIEKRFRSAEAVEEKIELLEEMMSVVPKHKGTDHLRADLRRRLAKLREEAQVRKSTSRHDSIYRIPKAGAGQIVVVGPGMVGKTSLVAALAGAPVDPSNPPRRTWEPEPVMMPFEDIQVQLIDTPPLSREYVEPRLRDLIRRADEVLLVVDLEGDPISQVNTGLELLEGFHILPLERRGITQDDRSLIFLPMLIAVNRCDDETADELYQIFCELEGERWSCLPVSARNRRNLERLKQELVARLDIIRVYTKAPGNEPDTTHPFVLKNGCIVEDLAVKIHKDFLTKMKTIRVWGRAVYDGQMVQRDYVLQDGDIVEIHP